MAWSENAEAFLCASSLSQPSRVQPRTARSPGPGRQSARPPRAPPGSCPDGPARAYAWALTPPRGLSASHPGRRSPSWACPAASPPPKSPAGGALAASSGRARQPGARRGRLGQARRGSAGGLAPGRGACGGGDPPAVFPPPGSLDPRREEMMCCCLVNHSSRHIGRALRSHFLLLLLPLLPLRLRLFAAAAAAACPSALGELFYSQ